MLRPISRTVPRLASSAQLSKHAIRRSFADQAPTNSSKVDSTRSVPPNSSGATSRLPFILIGGVIFTVVAGRYIFLSDKPARSGQAEQQAAKREGNISNRDPRDSGVKTLEQKQQKE